MKTFNTHVIALAIGLTFGLSGGAMAQGPSKNDYKADSDKIAEQYKSAKAACASLSGNSKDVCMVEAKGKEKTEKAELEASYKPTPKAHYHARVAKAEAEYSVAKERCDEKIGNAKDVCVKEAKSAEIAAKADVKVQMETSSAKTTAAEKTSAARNDASEKMTEARKDAAADKMDAQYTVEKQKCDTYAGDAKASCLNALKPHFEKP